MKFEVTIQFRSPRFQLIRSEIESLAPQGIYHFIADRDGSRIEYKATREQLEKTFARAMRTMSYRDRGRFNQHPWPLAEQFRV